MAIHLRLLLIGALVCSTFLALGPSRAQGETVAKDYAPGTTEMAALLSSPSVTSESTDDDTWDISLGYTLSDSDIEIYVSASVLPTVAAAHQFIGDQLDTLKSDNELTDTRNDFSAQDFGADELTQLHLIYEGENSGDRVGEYALLVRYGRVVALVEGASSPEADDRNTVDNDRSLAVLRTFALVIGKIQYSPADSAKPVNGIIPFAKDWGRHGLSLNVDKDGHGDVSWRVYKWCSDDPKPPCDEIINNEIHSGGKGTLIIFRVDGNTGIGSVIKSTDTDTLKLGPVTLQIDNQGMATLKQGDDTTDLCGPDFLKLAPPALQAQSPCGA